MRNGRTSRIWEESYFPGFQARSILSGYIDSMAIQIEDSTSKDSRNWAKSNGTHSTKHSGLLSGHRRNQT